MRNSYSHSSATKVRWIISLPINLALLSARCWICSLERKRDVGESAKIMAGGGDGTKGKL